MLLNEHHIHSIDVLCVWLSSNIKVNDLNMYDVPNLSSYVI